MPSLAHLPHVDAPTPLLLLLIQPLQLMCVGAAARATSSPAPGLLLLQLLALNIIQEALATQCDGVVSGAPHTLAHSKAPCKVHLYTNSRGCMRHKCEGTKS